MTPRKPHKEDHKAMSPIKSTASTGAGVVKRRYKKVRFHEDGLLNVERKKGKYFKMAQQNQRQSPLLRLPAELRNKIFAYALGGRTFDIRFKHHRYQNVTKSKHAFALLQACRQIYAETALLPFSTNIFSTQCPHELGEWAEKLLRPARAQSIIRVRLELDDYAFFGFIEECFTFGDLLLSSEICNRGYVVLPSNTLESCHPASREEIEELLQAQNEGVEFVWE